ncbi:cytochrome c-type biogenesis protein CcmH [Vibrio europaeus]|uniref:Cytochrome c-type biogenesis protein n=1 Tax=Vibrio europaeus TaxID=300876 RepID=A0A178JDW6_9VIBR|nr:cytochrome c-type biogenesis protein [Vibrio europaeus]MDC5703565.1 cytochrome c-type biogenesis protein CcmH [Vibrio europaeus]MDC5711280.1 cytochrome c-type biogenesis protein CcmH [Vibrio europaeus]MDC5714773.1 cytochrome c-type biogenesis protein CcmH [Vibrio europaeus]MDC5722327.1 cytochrome c-type biogenesis protein CcmH [Vibrio europaeus]MDC5727392.1 cytochrome c-type biogenesis protein CcmH [Vibrio europaeus]
MSLRLAFAQYLLLLLSMIAPLSLASANQDVFAAATTEQNVQVELFQFGSPHKQKVAIELAKSLRCPQCQNQNLVESNSPIAKDLRLIVFSKINQGQSEQQVIDFMTARYGEFVLYKPTFTASNALLWLAPILLFLLFLIVSFVRIEQRKQQ